MINVYTMRRKKHTFFNWLTVWATEDGTLPKGLVPTHMLTTYTHPITFQEIAIQSNKLRPHIVSLNDWLELEKETGNERTHVEKYSIPCNTEQLKRYIKESYRIAMTSEYDVKGAVAIGLFRKFGIKFREFIDDDQSFSCAELSLHLIEHAFQVELGRESLYGPLSAIKRIREWNDSRK